MRIAFERVGAGEPLVLLHGLGHRRQAWYPVLDQLAEHREVILVDLPGHGESGPLDTGGRPLIDALRSAFHAFLDEQELIRPHMAGNSVGGRIALEAGIDGRAGSITAFSPAGFWQSERAFAYSRGLFTAMGGLARVLEPQAAALSRTRVGRMLAYGWLSAHPTRVNPEQALADFRAFRAAQPAMRTIIAAAVPFTGRVASDVRVTVAWADRDVVFPRTQAERARLLLPNAEHVMLRGCGHVPMTDDPHQVAQLILRGSASTPRDARAA